MQTSSVKKREKAATPAAPAAEDLSRLIDEQMEKHPGEQARTVHLFGQFYRCNWWVIDPDPNSIFVRTGRISRSQLLRAERVEAGLNIQQVPDRR